MIITVTLNPAYDVTYELAALTVGEVHRVARVRERPGGKGVNVASVLHSLTEPVLATGFASAEFAKAVAELGIPSRFVTALPRVRRTLVLVDPDDTTSLWEPGIALPCQEIATKALVDLIKSELPGAGCLVVSGSLPPNLEPPFVASLAAQADEAGVPVVVDVSGTPLTLAAQVPGTVLMPNSDELSALAQELDLPPPDTVDSVVAGSRALVAAGVRAVFATRGAQGLIATDASGSWLVRPPRKISGNPTGAGDAAAAAVARGLAAQQPLDAVAVAAVATSAAAVAAAVAGEVDVHLIDELAPHITAERLPD